MKDNEIITIAETYLKNYKINFVTPGEIGIRESQRVEVIFLIPEALDPNIVVDPPDVRMWINILTSEVTWIPQM